MILWILFSIFTGDGWTSTSNHPKQANDWAVCGDLNVNPIPSSPVLSEPRRVIFVFEGNSGYHPKTATALRKSAPFDLSSPVGEKSISGAFALDHFIRDLFTISPTQTPGRVYYPPGSDLSGWSLNHSYWLYYSYQGTSNAVACAEKIAKISYPGSPSTHSTISTIGFSNGGASAFSFAKRLAKKGISIDLGISVDPIKSPGKIVGTLFVEKFTGLSRPKNANRWVNFYQRKGTLLKGRSIKTADLNQKITDVSGHLEITDKVAPLVADELSRVPVSRLNFAFHPDPEDLKSAQVEDDDKESDGS